MTPAKLKASLPTVLVCFAILAGGLLAIHTFLNKPTPSPHTPTPMNAQKDIPENAVVATFAGGCFWCIEAPYQETAGVYDAVSGYTGGTADDASYSKVARGQTKHREAVQVTYNPDEITYNELLDIFWRQIDPTDAGGQFADRGFQYTTAIYAHDMEQKMLAENSKQALEDSKKFDDPIATLIVDFENFYPAEEYHQDYYKKSAAHYERYKKGSGRQDFIDENWARKAALEYADAHVDDTPPTSGTTYSRPSDADIKEMLTDLQYKVTQRDGTETPFENEYWDNKEDGIYVDVVSGEPLFSSTHKYKSGTGWPSFWQPIDEEFIKEKRDFKLIIPRTEIRSTYGDSHIGHVFKDGPDPTGLRYCMNSAAMRFVPKADMEAEGYGEYLYLFSE